ncbi:Asp23/Gls24 family envelope stress response protein [Paenibacillus xylanilyticus]|uniref:Asp23/Gls24 family envelope stress response protein n=1 Tax=Paenibacillus xylanilyticus TaxID=248903 RepID=A0A7Y6EVF5_9BACL|nr:Asp23/Gls24 family envelope stress response protein [Paenibacillus xylanilyticus]NUU76631.1 Asp23/Gls24 family envelope stress response protein [Paenibacillus xylanilyticus]
MSEIIPKEYIAPEYIEPQSVQIGAIHISNDVVSKIVGMAAQATSGISSMSVGLTEGIAKSISGKSLQKGIDVEVKEDQASIQLRINVQYGFRMHQVCQELQHNVQQAVEQLTGIMVKEIKVHVVGVTMQEQV